MNIVLRFKALEIDGSLCFNWAAAERNENRRNMYELQLKLLVTYAEALHRQVVYLTFTTLETTRVRIHHYFIEHCSLPRGAVWNDMLLCSVRDSVLLETAL